MGIFKKRRIEEVTEERADEVITPPTDNVLLETMLGRTVLTKEQALNIPSISGCIKYAANMVSMLPIKLYKEVDGTVTEIKDDHRVRLLNDDTGDTLDAVQMWRAIITDYYLGKGGYIYINKSGNEVKSLHYVDESQITANKNYDPIFKGFELLVNAKSYQPFQFLKILRNTKDGSEGIGIVEENSIIINVAYNTMLFEQNLVLKGGNKKGFLKSPKKLTQEVLDSLRDAFRKLYSNNSENVVVLNDGIDFKEASNTSVEMQLNENKKTNADEICKLFLFSPGVISGSGTDLEHKNAFRAGIMPILRAIESALNRDLLLEKEKGSFYFAIDTKEMLKGSLKERYEAYSIGVEKGFLNIDEIRYTEDLPAFDINWINLGLNSVLYDTKTKQIYTPNTNQQSTMSDTKKEEPPDDTSN